MEERQPEKRNDKNNRNNRNRNRNRGNRDGGDAATRPRDGSPGEGDPQEGGQREDGNSSAKPEQIMAYVDDAGGNDTVSETPAAVPKADNPDSPRPENPRQGRNSGRPDGGRPDRQPNDRQRDNNPRQDRDRQDRNRPKGDPRQGGPREGGPREGENPNRETDANRLDAGTPDASDPTINRPNGGRAESGRAERADSPRPEGGGRSEGSRQQQPNQRERGERDRNRGDRDRDRGRDREPDKGRDRDQERERPTRTEPDLSQEWSREDELRPGDSRPGESRLGQMKITDLAGRGADVAPEDRLVVGITLGDYNGIGPEVILKALQYNQLQRVCTPVIYGSMRVLNRYRNLLNLKDWNLNGIQNVEQASHKMTNVITCWNENAHPNPTPAPPEPPKPEPTTLTDEVKNDELPTDSESEVTTGSAESQPEVIKQIAPIGQIEETSQPSPLTHEIQPGKVTPEAGQAALACLERAVEDLKAGKIHALITGPINKHTIQSEAFKFPGHTEYLAEAFGVPDGLMFMVSETLRVGVVTGHVPLAKVRQNMTRNAIHQKLTMMMQSLKVDFGIEKPSIAVLGLNPHAGENGLLGNEEQETIIPVIEDWRKKGELVYGPFPADGFFGTRGYRKYDAVLAMYHDQGLIPFKAIAFEEGVNFTAGLPIVRTSPDHGTAYDIAGKNLADETSMTQAIYVACDVARRRKEHTETEANALKK